MKVKEIVETTKGAEDIAIIIQYVCWAIANRENYISQVYFDKDYADLYDHEKVYLNEKIERANNNFIGWWSNVDRRTQAKAIQIAVEYYDN
jgi:hypothetical protein